MPSVQLVIFAIILVARVAFAGTTLQGTLTPGEFAGLATELGAKVPLFGKVWEEDPDAVFFGGTARDFLFWVKRQFRNAKTPEDVRAVIARLRAQESIDAKDFLLPGSDVDVMSAKGKLTTDPRPYGLTPVTAYGPSARY